MKLLFLFVPLLLFGCTRSKFTYLEKVRIKHGFYKGTIGRVHKFSSWRGYEFRECMLCDGRWIGSEGLEKEPENEGKKN